MVSGGPSFTLGSLVLGRVRGRSTGLWTSLGQEVPWLHDFCLVMQVQCPWSQPPAIEGWLRAPLCTRPVLRKALPQFNILLSLS